MAENIFSRRDFIKTFTTLVGGTLVLASGRGVGKILYRGMQNIKDHHNDIEFGLDEGLKQKIAEIVEYRKSFQLIGLPRELNINNVTKSKSNNWDNQPPKFVVDVPPQNLSYADRAKEIFNIVLGPNYSRVINGIIGYGMPGQTASNGNLIVTVSDLHDKPIEGDGDYNFTDLSLHEGTHSFYTGNIDKFPLDILIKISHGFWRALTRAYSIPEQFYHNPGDAMLPVLYRRIGESIGRRFVEDSSLIDTIANLSGHDKIKSILKKIAKTENKNVSDLKFSKKNIYLFGEKLIPLIMSGEIKLEGEILNEYANIVEDNFIEISAEMFRYAIFHPDKINYDIDILEGIEEG